MVSKRRKGGLFIGVWTWWRKWMLPDGSGPIVNIITIRVVINITMAGWGDNGIKMFDSTQWPDGHKSARAGDTSGVLSKWAPKHHGGLLLKVAMVVGNGPPITEEEALNTSMLHKCVYTVRNSLCIQKTSVHQSHSLLPKNSRQSTLDLFTFIPRYNIKTYIHKIIFYTRWR